MLAILSAIPTIATLFAGVGVAGVCGYRAFLSYQDAADTYERMGKLAVNAGYSVLGGLAVVTALRLLAG